MPSSKPDGEPDPASTWGLPELSLLADLGFGPASQLMTEPKLFVDARFLASLQIEFEEELGVDAARAVLFQIGLMHGLRDALAAGDLDGLAPGLPAVFSTSPLAMRFGTLESGPDGLETRGTWPDRHEADARLRAGAVRDHACALSAGYTSGWLSGALDVDMLAVETSCSAAGEGDCTFRAREVDAWRLDADADGADDARALLARVSISQLRSLVRTRFADRTGAPATSIAEFVTTVERDDPAVHVWGPVMVMPFTDADTALSTVEMLSRDPAMQAVRAVVVDLEGAILDDGFGAAGLEQLIEDVEAWGADVILTGVSPFSEDVVAELEATHLLVRKDLPEAIAYAFQIAESHRQLL